MVCLACVTVVLMLAIWIARPRAMSPSKDEMISLTQQSVVTPTKVGQPVPKEAVSRLTSVPRTSNKESRSHDPQPVASQPRLEHLVALADKWGIEASGIRLSAGGRALDIRYKVVDSGKAKSLPGSQESIYIVDQATGAKVAVPSLPKRQASRMVIGRSHFMLAANTRQLMKPGNKVMLVMGNAASRDLTVE
jgi:hypothetical protein